MNSRPQINKHERTIGVSGEEVVVVCSEINGKYTFDSITVKGLPTLHPRDRTFNSLDELMAEVPEIVNNMKS